MDGTVQPVGEMSLSGAEEDSAEGGDDLLDLGRMIGNKVALLPTFDHLLSFFSSCTAIHPTVVVMQTLSFPTMAAYMQAPSTTSTGGAAVASSFNFTKAAEMRAAAMQRQSSASPASAPVRALQPGVELLGRATEAGARPAAQPGGSVSGAALPTVTPTGSTQGAAGGAVPAQAAGGTAGVQPIAVQLCQYMLAVLENAAQADAKTFITIDILVAFDAILDNRASTPVL